jgi:protein-S-isoprenylcysteine O-methyltransferase Ste14
VDRGGGQGDDVLMGVGQAALSRWISPPVAFVMAATAMWWISRGVEFGRHAWPYQSVVGVTLIALGLAIVAVSLTSFATAGTTPNPMRTRKATKLVTDGVYAWSRNPMYVGDAVMLAGIAVWSGSVLSVVPLAAFVAYVDRVQIKAEEEALTATFGDRYAAYRRRVRRWL